MLAGKVRSASKRLRWLFSAHPDPHPQQPAELHSMQELVILHDVILDARGGCICNQLECSQSSRSLRQKHKTPWRDEKATRHDSVSSTSDASGSKDPVAERHHQGYSKVSKHWSFYQVKVRPVGFRHRQRPLLFYTPDRVQGM